MVLIILGSDAGPAGNATVKLTRKNQFSLRLSFKKINTKFQTIKKIYAQRCARNGSCEARYNNIFSSKPWLSSSHSQSLNINDIGSNCNEHVYNADAEDISDRSNSLVVNSTESSFCPIYHPYSSNKDFAYRSIYTEMHVEKYEKIVELPLQSNFNSFLVCSEEINDCFPPSQYTQSRKIVHGPIFVNSRSPVVIQGGECGPVEEWYFTLNINRSYYENEFHAQISLSCKLRKVPNSDTSDVSEPCQFPLPSQKKQQNLISELFVGVELQLLNSSGDVQLSRRCDEELHPVSNEIVARYNVPYFLDLRTLQDPAKGLINNLECYCRVLITCITGHEHITNATQSLDNADNIISWEIFRDRTLHTYVNNSSGCGIIMKTNNNSIKIPIPFIHFVNSRCPSLLSETRNGILHLETFTSNSVINILRYVTTGRAKQNIKNFSELQETIELAQRYKLSHLKHVYTEMLGENLCPKEAANALVLAFIYGAGTRTCSKIKDFFLCNMDQVMGLESTRFYVENCPLAFTSIIFGPILPVDDCDLELKLQFTKESLNAFLQNTFQSLVNDVI